MKEYIKYKDINLERLLKDNAGCKSFIISSIKIEEVEGKNWVKYSVSTNPYDEENRSRLKFDYFTNLEPTVYGFYREFWEKGVMSISILNDTCRTFYVFCFERIGGKFNKWLFLNFLKTELEELSHVWVVDENLFIVSPMGAKIERKKR